MSWPDLEKEPVRRNPYFGEIPINRFNPDFAFMAMWHGLSKDRWAEIKEWVAEIIGDPFEAREIPWIVNVAVGIVAGNYMQKEIPEWSTYVIKVDSYSKLILLKLRFDDIA